MNRILRSSTALVASLALVAGHVPVAAMAQAVDTTSPCLEGETEEDCLARQLDAEATGGEATVEAEEAPEAASAPEDPAIADADGTDAPEAVIEAPAPVEDATATEAQPAAAPEADPPTEDIVDTPSELPATEDEVGASDEAAAPENDGEAAAEDPGPIAETDASQDSTAPEAETEVAAPEAETAPATAADATDATQDAPAAEAGAQAEAESYAPEAADAETSPEAETPQTTEAEAEADPDGRTQTQTDVTTVVEADALSAEDRAAVDAAQETAAAAELDAGAVDPVAEAEAEVAAAETEANEALQSLALQADTAPVAATTEEVITEENVRRSDEDFQQLLTETNEATEARDEDTRGLTGTQGLILGGIAGLAIGAIINGNRQVVNRADDRLVVLRPEGDYQVIRDDDTLLRRPGNTISTDTFEDGSSRNVVTQPDGTRIITVRDRDLRILRRTVVAPDGTRAVLIDDIAVQTPVVVSELPELRQDTAPSSVGLSGDAAAIARALEARTFAERGFSLAQVRSIRAVRNLAPALNLESVTFETGSAAITPDQAQQLLQLGRYMAGAIADNPREIFLIEGHTDATGSASLNLGLSDRRAETVALALTEFFGVPAQNMVIQGYGEEFLLIPTLDNERLNRRVAVRRITDLLRVAAAE